MSARALAMRVLTRLEKGRIERIREPLAQARLPPRDRAFAWELAHGVLRTERFLDFVAGTAVDRGLPRDPLLLVALRLGIYQLLFVDGMPPRAAVHETVALLRRNQAFANAVLRRIGDRLAARAADPAQPDLEVALSPRRALVLPAPGLLAAADPVAVRYSLPDFLLSRWRRTLGEGPAAAVAAASSAVPRPFLRAMGGWSGGDLAAALAAEGVACSATGDPQVLRCDGGLPPVHTELFRDGAFVVQDPTAARAALAVAAVPGATVVDLCAAPGTKTVLLAERVRPDGVVFAHDPDPRRRGRIGENAARLRLLPWIRVVDDPAALPVADAVLADVPCSNTGVLARRVEVRRRLAPETFAALARVQEQILRRAVGLVRPGGQVVYSTCSIEPEENEQVVAAVAAATDVRVERAATTLPREGVCDGGFCAVLRDGRAAGVPGGAPPG